MKESADPAGDATDRPSVEAPLDSAGLLRYAVVFTAIVAPASLVFLSLPAGVLATWLVARLIARRYRRPITAREALHLALACWLGFCLASLLAGEIRFAVLRVLPLVLVFPLIWAGFHWLARFVIKRNVAARPPEGGPLTGSDMLSEQRERRFEATARSLTLGFGWFSFGFLGLFLSIVLAGIIGAVLALLGAGEAAQTVFFLLVPAGMLGVLSGWAYYVQRKASEVFPSQRLVLWLRRFHQADLMAFPFPAFLESFCRGIAVPITLQDSSVSEATTAAQLRPAYFVLRAVGMIGGSGLVVSVVAALRVDDWRDPQLAIGCVGALASFAAIVASAQAVKRLGVVRLGTPQGRALADSLMRAIESKAGVPQTLTVVSTPDADWQDWVVRFIERADAVIVDVTHLSENLYWELHMLTERLSPRQVVIAYGHVAGGAPAMPAEMEDELAMVLGQPMMDTCHRFYYSIPERPRWHFRRPARSQGKGWLRPPKALADAYAEQLADALHDAFSASDASREPRAARPDAERSSE